MLPDYNLNVFEMLLFVHVHVDYTYRIDLYMYIKGFSLIGGGRVGLFNITFEFTRMYRWGGRVGLGVGVFNRKFKFTGTYRISFLKLFDIWLL